jgi:geranylgeranyl pyrophosphate synthase
MKNKNISKEKVSGVNPVPQSKAEREMIFRHVEKYAGAHALIPPLTVDEIKKHAAALRKNCRIDKQYSDFISVLLGNTLWRETVGAVPFNRRVFLIPHCLRDKTTCTAEMDEFGLLCRECGKCFIGPLKKNAESLGYIVLVAEGTTLVTSLIEQGRIDAVIGVGCLSSLERIFPYATSNAVPGLAIPLLQNGCINTKVDFEWVMDTLNLRSESRNIRHVDYHALQKEVASWFSLGHLRTRFKTGNSIVEKTAVDYLAKAGKRWRPFFVAASYRTLNQSSDAIPDTVKTLALSIECFHKASLIHDDIEDGDELRDGEKTLHAKYGVPVALNIGDFLLGEGYRLIAECNLPPVQKELLLKIASQGHKNLCIGQGEELSRRLSSVLPLPKGIINIASMKTAPAFEVAFLFGAIAAGADDKTCNSLKDYSRHLGIAYQISDDMKDASRRSRKFPELSINLAVANELAKGTVKKLMADAWKNGCNKRNTVSFKKCLGSPEVTEKVRKILEHHRKSAFSCATGIDNFALKTLLYRLIGRIVKA